MSIWAQLPPELLQEIAQKHTNYVDYLSTRAVCKSWQAAISKRPHNLLCQLPFLLLPYHQQNSDHRGFYNIPNNKTYFLELPEAFGKRCCGSSYGWLIMVEDSPTIFLLNPLTRARIDLPSLSTFPNFPTDIVFHNSRNLDHNFIIREKLHVRDTFIVKAMLSADPSLTSDFIVVVIYSFNENLAFCKSGDTAWTVIDETSPPRRYKDAIFHERKLYAVDQMGRISISNYYSIENSMIRVADTPTISPKLGFKQWYLANSNEELLLVSRYRNLVPGYEYKTERFEVYKLDGGGWVKKENLGDKMLFLGGNTSLSISALNYTNCKGNCIYFTDDYIRLCKDYVWEGHDYGVFEFENGKIRSLELLSYPIKQPCFTNIFYFEHSLYRDRSLFILPPPVWVTISP